MTSLEMLQRGRIHDVAGRLTAAANSYEDTLRTVGESREPAVRIEALRRLGVVRHRCGAHDEGRELCRRSYRQAVEQGALILAGEALNALAGFDFEAGQMGRARTSFAKALTLAEGSPALIGRIDQNLGILDSVQGEHDGAFIHYRRALESFKQAGEEGGCAIAWHNLGLTSSRRGELDEAERCFRASAEIAVRVGDVYLEGLCELHHAEVSHARQQYGEALERAEAALGRFERLEDQRARSDAHKVIGKILRDSGKHVLAEVRLTTAVRLASDAGWALGEADASRELARLHSARGRNQEALALLRSAQGLFGQLDAKVDLKDIVEQILALAA